MIVFVQTKDGPKMQTSELKIMFILMIIVNSECNKNTSPLNGDLARPVLSLIVLQDHVWYVRIML